MCMCVCVRACVCVCVCVCVCAPPYSTTFGPSAGDRYSTDKVQVQPGRDWGHDQGSAIQPCIYTHSSTTQLELPESSSVRALAGQPVLSDLFVPFRQPVQVRTLFLKQCPDPMSALFGVRGGCGDQRLRCLHCELFSDILTASTLWVCVQCTACCPSGRFSSCQRRHMLQHFMSIVLFAVQL